MTIKDEIHSQVAAPAGRGSGWFAAAGLAGALLASACCIVPILLFSLGISGAWIGNLTQLAPYKPLTIAVTVALIGGGYWLVYRNAKRACAPGEACARPLPNRIVMTMLIAATIIAVGAFSFDFIAPLLLS